MTDIEATRLDWVGEHRRNYLRSGGAEGHIVDLREIGGRQFTTTLLLQTIGRKSGAKRITPLIYGDSGGQEVAFQIATQAFRGNWREPTQEECPYVWAFMVNLYPPYKEYQRATAREIPLVMLSALTHIEVFKE